MSKNKLSDLYINAINRIKKGLFYDAENILLFILENEYVNGLYFQLGFVYFSQSKYNKCIEYFEKSIDKNELVIKSYYNIGLSYKGNHYKAISYIQKVINIFKNNNKLVQDEMFNYSKFYQILSIIYKYIGDYDNSRKYALISIKEDKYNTESIHIISSFTNSVNNSEYLKLLDSYKKKLSYIEKKGNNLYTSLLYFSLGKSENELGDYKKSFEYYTKGNKFKSLHHQKLFPIEPNYENIKNNIFTKYNNYDLTKISKTKNYPQVIFIVGLPRSGSTLIETIISYKSRTKSLGEYMGIVDALHFNNVDYYFNNLNKFIDINNLENIDFLIDKQLVNFKNIPFLIKNFNNCRIINMIRNPLDNILSMFTTNLYDISLYNTTDFNLILKYFNFWCDVMKYWKELYPNNIYDCYYDKIVDNPKKYISELLEYLEFEWSDDYLEFYKSKNNIGTASNYQVKQPIYKTSSKRWKNYSDDLKPIIKLLNENGIKY